MIQSPSKEHSHQGLATDFDVRSLLEEHLYALDHNDHLHVEVVWWDGFLPVRANEHLVGEPYLVRYL